MDAEVSSSTNRDVATAPASRGLGRGVIAFGIIAIIVIDLLIALTLVQERRATLDRAREATLGAARAYAAHVDRALHQFEEMLGGLVALAGESLDVTTLTRILHAQKAATPYLMDLLILGSDGTVRAWTGEGTPPRIDDRPYWTVHRDNPFYGLYLGPPTVSRVHTDQWFFAMSSRIADAEGGFAGVAVVILDITYLIDAFDRLRQHDGEAAALIDLDGTVMARVPGPQGSIGVRIPGIAAARGSLPEESTMIADSPFDRDPEPRVISQRRVSRYPLLVSASVPARDALRPWGAIAWRGALTGVGATLLLAWLTWALARRTAAHAEALRLAHAHRTAQEAEHRLTQTLIDALPVMVFIKGPDGRYQRCNRWFLDFFRRSATEVAGLTLEDLAPGSDATEHSAQADARVLREGGWVGFETEIVGPGGHRTMWFTNAALPGPDGKPVGIIGSAIDVTDRKAAETQARDAQQRAERALEDLKRAQQRMVQSEKLASLGGLVAGIAHEVNTPIGITLTGASHLAAETARLRRLFDDRRLTASDMEAYIASAEEACRLLVGNCQRAADLIQSFKQVAVDQTSGDRRIFLLKPYIDEVLLSLRPAIKKAPHAIVVDCPDTLELDGFPGALSQVLTNLLVNALVHAFEPGQHGTVTIAARLIDDATVDLQFADDGIGIPLENQTRVFEPFFSTRRSAGGSGLGLNIVYNIVTRTLRGSLRLDSIPGQGTRFILRFPRVIPTTEQGRDA